VLRQARPNDPSILILQSYLGHLLNDADGLAPQMTELADRQIRELLANIINPASELASSAGYGGIKAARLSAVQAEVRRRIADPALNLAVIGNRLGISERYVQQLLEGAGFSFGLRARMRLERAPNASRSALRRQAHIRHLRVVRFRRLVLLQAPSGRFGKRPRTRDVVWAFSPGGHAASGFGSADSLSS
jgi:hypothetical protein